MFDGASGSGRDGERVDLHDVAGLFEGHVFGFAGSVRALFRGRSGRRLTDERGNLRHDATLDQFADDASDGSVTDRKSLFA